MIIYIDIKTLALTTEGHVPLTDMALVRGDQVPLRIVLTDGPGQPADSDEVPVLAVKKSLGDDALVLAATGLERVEDALGIAYVGSLSVNTVQLATAMGDQDRIDLVGEVVLVAPGGAQRTSRLIRVTVRADLLPGDYAPPIDIVTNWPELIAAALAARLPDALHDAGVYLTPVPGAATLTVTGGALAYALGYYRLPLAASAVVGHIAGSYNINRLTITAPASHNNGTAWMMRLWRYVSGTMIELGTSTDQATWAATDEAKKMTCSWVFNNISVDATDIIVLQVYDAAGSSKTIQGYARQVGTEDGMGICTVSAGVPQIIHTCAMGMTLDITYQDGIGVGGVELASKADFGALAQDVVATSTQVHQDAQSASDAATAAQQALAAMPQVDANGNMTLPGNLAAQGGTFSNKINANGGVNIPVDPVAGGDAVNLASLPMSLFAPGHALLLLKSLCECYGTADDTACGIKFKDLTSGGFGGLCTRVMQWSDYASTATILTVITLTGGNGANVLIDAAYNPNAGVSITPVTSPGMAFLPNAVQLSLFETRQNTTVTGRLVGVDGTIKTFSVPSQRDSHSCVYRVFLLETAGVIKFYLGQFTSGMFDGDADVLARPVYLGEMPVPNNPRRYCYLGIGGIPGGDGNSFPFRIPVISDVRRYYGPWLLNLFTQS